MRQEIFRRETIGETERLVLELQSDAKPDYFALNMMSHNEMTHIIPAELVHFNESDYIAFRITNMTMLKKRLIGGVTKNNAIAILSSILNAFEEAESFMLDLKNLYLNENYVYIDDKNVCHMLYLPLDEAGCADVIAFLKKTVENIQSDPSEKDPYLYDILNTFNRGGVKTISDFREVLKKCENTVGQRPVFSPGKETVGGEDESVGARKEGESKERKEKQEKHVNNESVDKRKPVSPAKLPVMNIPGRTDVGMRAVPDIPNIPNIPNRPETGKGKAEKGKKSAQKSVRKGFSIGIHFGGRGKRRTEETEAKLPHDTAYESSRRTGSERKKDEIYESYEDTILMDDACSGAEAYTVQLDHFGTVQLIRKRDNCAFILSEGDNTFGSGGDARHRIPGNKAISRIHAAIEKQGDRYYLTDFGSTNGTFLNGRRLSAHDRAEVDNGAVIVFADEEFEFKMDESNRDNRGEICVCER